MFTSSRTKLNPRWRTLGSPGELASAFAAMERIIAGEQLTAVAAAMQIAQPVLSKRVQQALRILNSHVGISSLDIRKPRRSIFVLRHHGADVKEAIDRYRSRIWSSHEPQTADDTPFRSAFSAMQSLRPERSLSKHKSQLRTAILYTAWHTGLSSMEMARLRICDFLTPEGSIHQATIAVSHRSDRNLQWSDERVKSAIDSYLTQRAVASGKRPDRPYRGFDPDARLFEVDDIKAGSTDLEAAVAKRINSFLNGVARAAGFPTSFVKTARLDLAN